MRNDLPGPAAVRTGLLHLKKSARGDHLTRTAASRAALHPARLAGAAAVALLAGLRALQFHLFFNSARRFLQGDFNVVAQITAAGGAGPVALAAAAKELLEDAATA